MKSVRWVEHIERRNPKYLLRSSRQTGRTDVEEVDIGGWIILNCILNVSLDDSGAVEDRVDCVYGFNFNAYAEHRSTFGYALLEYDFTDEQFAAVYISSVHSESSVHKRYF